ncbi:MAG: sodium:solute symporter family protein, partial [Bacteroidota bacterium]|nr:sodium:solute symporter family protein [Bacteroidota bacterium]
MHWIDVSIFVLYMVAMLGIGFFFMRKNTSTEDYYVGGRTMNKWHVGLSVVATDVGGGFSIGLGGLGFTMGLSGSWMLFTGLLGAWLSAVMIIPRVSKLSQKVNLLTFPQVFEHLFDRRVAFIAGIISAIGYLGFTSSQILAGAKLASATFPTLSMNQALILLGVIAVTYTVLGGLKAVIYTDTVQWAVLMAGLVFIGIPLGLDKIGGWDAVRSTLSAEYIEFDNLSWVQLANWGITIIPIWFVGMTLYQRIYSCRNHKEAQRAWFIAGLFEWPVMALMGVALGLFARVGFEQGMFGYLGYESAGDLDPEMGLPLFLRTILPVGLMGLMMSAYFSAIMSTADSCLMAASGSTVTDLLSRFYKIREEKQLRISQI